MTQEKSIRPSSGWVPLFCLYWPAATDHLAFGDYGELLFRQLDRARSVACLILVIPTFLCGAVGCSD